jgi:hypothetical protein
MKKCLYISVIVCLVLSFMGCATGKPLLITTLDEIGWDRAESFQCYLSSRITLTKLPDDSSPAELSFSNDGAAFIRDARWTIVLPTSLEGRILNYHQRDQYLNVAFEEGRATLPFALDKNGRFSLMLTVDRYYQNGVEFVEYEGARYKPQYAGEAPYLMVVLNRSEDDLRRQMQGSRVDAVVKTEDVVRRAGEKLAAGLPERAVVAVLNVFAGEKELSSLIMEELEFQLLESGKFKIVDRTSLDTLRAERNFQMSGEVSDESAVSIGNMLGANIVITGALRDSAGVRRLTLKALDVESAEIVVSAREEF